MKKLFKMHLTLALVYYKSSNQGCPNTSR